MRKIVSVVVDDASSLAFASVIFELKREKFMALFIREFCMRFS